MSDSQMNAASLSRRALLETLRTQIVAASHEASARDLPGLSRELRLVMKELAGLSDEVERVSAADEIRARRAARRAQPRRHGLAGDDSCPN